jgi:hypothetical protein
LSSAAATAGTVCKVNALRPWWAVAYLAGNAQRAHPKRDRISGRLQLGLHHAHACAQELTSAWTSRCAIWPGLPAAFSCSGLLTSLMLKRKREAGHRTAIFLTVMLSIALTLPLRSVGAAIRFDRGAGGRGEGLGAVAIRCRIGHGIQIGLTCSLFSLWKTNIVHRGQTSGRVIAEPAGPSANLGHGQRGSASCGFSPVRVSPVPQARSSVAIPSARLERKGTTKNEAVAATELIARGGERAGWGLTVNPPEPDLNVTSEKIEDVTECAILRHRTSPHCRESSMTNRHLTTLVLGFGLLGAAQASPAQGTNPYSIDVSYLSTSPRQAEEYFRANVVAYADYGVPARTWNKFLGEHRIGTVLLEADHFFRNSGKMADLDSYLREKDARVMQIIEAGGTVMFAINCATPRFNSIRPEMTSSILGESEDAPIWACSPPADYAIYAQMIFRLIFHFNRELNTQGRVIYNFGNEPDNYFAGTPADLYSMYSAFVAAARSADPNVKIGGLTPVVHTQNTLWKAFPVADAGGKVSFQSATTDSGKPLIEEWIEYSARNSLPIDFVSWHHYPAPNPIPLTPEGPAWIRSDRDISTWLQAAGFQGAGLYLLDWPDWKVDLREHDNEFYPAHIAAGYIGMIEQTSVIPVQTGLQDINQPNYVDLEYARENAGFGGGVGIFNLLGIAKPVNNMYSMFGRLIGKLDFPHTGNPFIKAASSVDRERVAILLTNFVPSDRMVDFNAFQVNMSSEEKALVESYLRTYVRENRHKISDEILSDEVAFMRQAYTVLDAIDLTHYPLALQKYKDNIGRALSAVDQMAQQIETASSVALNVADLPAGQWAVRHYVVDKDHANAYTDRHIWHGDLAQAVANGNRSRIVGIVDGANAQTGLEAGLTRSEAWQVQAPDAKALAFEMLPYSVHLIEIERIGN